MTYDTNSYGEIVNGQGTYDATAADLAERGQVVLNWADGEGTKFNVLFAFDPQQVGSPGGIIDDGPDKIWVAIAGRGSFAFSASGGTVTTAYAAEKLFPKGYSAGITVRIVADLVTGVRKAVGELLTLGYAAKGYKKEEI
jgi:hypothetical protein